MQLYKSPCRSVHRSVPHLLFLTISIPEPIKLVTAPAQNQATGFAVYPALLITDMLYNLWISHQPKVELLAPEDDVTRRMSVRLAIMLEQLEGDVKACKKAKKTKNLPRGDYLEFVRLTSVCIIAVFGIND